jgi:predicted Fe-Mo cluster-binding NifX family protein
VARVLLSTELDTLGDVMKIAIPLFGTRVSPRIEFAPEFLLVEPDAGEGHVRERIPVAHWSPAERAARLAGLGVGVVICGGISRFLAEQLASQGIQVYSWVSGEVDHALQCFLTGQLESGVMAGPGGACGRWQIRCGGRRGRGAGGGRGRGRGGSGGGPGRGRRQAPDSRNSRQNGGAG